MSLPATGDQLLIGKETARQLGMGPHMYTTDALLRHAHTGDQKDAPYKKELVDLVLAADGFAEVRLWAEGRSAS